MPYYQLVRSVRHSFFLVSIVLLGACKAQRVTEILTHSSVEESIESAKVAESGPSAITYDSKTGTNTAVWTEYTLFGFATSLPKEEMSYEPLRDSFHIRDENESPQLGLKFGLEYVGKGAKFAGGSTIKLNYLEIPLDILYHYPLGPGSARGGLGPYFAEGIGGGGANSIYGANAGGFRRFDAGLNVRVGYELAMGLYLDFSYDLGLANVEYPTGDGTTGHNRSFGINLGFQIGKLFAK